MFRLMPIRIGAALLAAVGIYLAGYVAWKAYDQMTRGITYVVIHR